MKIQKAQPQRLAQQGYFNRNPVDEWSTARKDGSKETAKSYTAAVKRFRSWIMQKFSVDQQQAEEILLYADATLIRNYKLHMKEESLKNTTINAQIAGLKNFYQFFVFVPAPDKVRAAHEVLDANPTDSIKREKSDRGTCSVLEKNQVDSLIEAIRKQRNILKAHRDYAIVRLALTSGLRSFEIAGTKRKDLFQLADGNWYLHVRRKGGKTEDKKLAHAAAAAILDYLELRGDVEKNDPLFVVVPSPKDDPSAKPGESGYPKRALSRAGISMMIKKAAIAGNIEAPVSAHSLRHTVAMKGSEKEMAAAQQFLGHSQLRTTQEYVNHHRKRRDSGMADELDNFFFGDDDD